MPLKHQHEKEHSRAINVQRCLYRTSLFFRTLWYSWFQLVHRELRISPYSTYSLEPCILGCAPRVESDLSGITFLTFFFCFFEGLCEDAQKALKPPMASCDQARQDGSRMARKRLHVLQRRLFNKINILKGEGK